MATLNTPVTSTKISANLLCKATTSKLNDDAQISGQSNIQISSSTINERSTQIIQIYNRHMGATNKYNSLLKQITHFMKHKELSPPLRERVMRYVEFKFQKNVYKEADIMKTLSLILRQDILLHNCQKIVEKVEFFKDLPTDVMLRIVSKLRPEVYLPNDTVVEAGIAGNSMFFIFLGTVAVYSPAHKEICHLGEGTHFGEICLVINEPRVATVLAVTECELFRLTRKDFQEAIEPFPELSKKIRDSALSRMEKTKDIA